MEIWKDIDGFAGFYQVSNKGNVKSLEREITYEDGRVYNYPSKNIKQTLDGRGYPTVGFNVGGNKSSHRVHRLVAENFIPRTFSLSPLEVNHIDGNKKNNNVENLEWVTSSENTLKGYEIGLFEKSRETSRYIAKQNKKFSRSIKTQVENIETGEVLIFNSASEASVHFGYKKNAFTEAMRVRNGIAGKNKELKVSKIRNQE